MAITIGAQLVYGGLPDLPVEVPGDVTWWKIRARSKSFATLYLRRGANIEAWSIKVADGRLVPAFRLAENRSKRACWAFDGPERKR